jgi:hypothetical protein
MYVENNNNTTNSSEDPKWSTSFSAPFTLDRRKRNKFEADGRVSARIDCNRGPKGMAEGVLMAGFVLVLSGAPQWGRS